MDNEKQVSEESEKDSENNHVVLEVQDSGQGSSTEVRDG